MLCMLAMLIVAQTVAASNKDLSLPIQCVLASPSRNSDRAADKFGTYWSLSVIIGYPIVVYSNKVIRLYSYDPDFGVLYWELAQFSCSNRTLTKAFRSLSARGLPAAAKLFMRMCDALQTL